MAKNTVEGRRMVDVDGKVFDFGFVKDMNQSYDDQYYEEPTGHIKLEAAVLGKAEGEMEVEGEKSSGLRLLIGRKYPNSRFTIPFTVDFIDKNIDEFDEIIEGLENFCDHRSKEVQAFLSDEQLAMGREVALKSAAARVFKKEALARGIIMAPDAIDEIFMVLDMRAPSKLFFDSAVTISGRRPVKGDSEDRRGLWKIKTMESSNLSGITMETINISLSGLKRVPVANAKGRKRAKDFVLQQAELAVEYFGDCSVYSEEDTFARLKRFVGAIGKYDRFDKDLWASREEDTARIAELVRNVWSEFNNFQKR
jgi:hypothetical protein